MRSTRWGIPKPPLPPPSNAPPCCSSSVCCWSHWCWRGSSTVTGGVGRTVPVAVATCCNPSVETWNASTHPKVDCITCHESPGALGGVETRVRALSDLRGQPVAAPVTLSSPATVNQENCISCHQKELSERHNGRAAARAPLGLRRPRALRPVPRAGRTRSQRPEEHRPLLVRHHDDVYGLSRREDRVARLQAPATWATSRTRGRDRRTSPASNSGRRRPAKAATRSTAAPRATAS